MLRMIGATLAICVLVGCAMDLGKGDASQKRDKLGQLVKPVRFRCESTNNNRHYCSVDTRAGVTLVEQLSRVPCLEGRNWGYDRFGVWVTYGCRAEFYTGQAEVGKASLSQEHAKFVQCESKEMQHKECPAKVSNSVRLIKQLSKSPCIENDSWGWSASTVWVDKGCRAEFRVR